MIINHHSIGKVDKILRNEYSCVGNLHITDLICDIYHYMESKDMDTQEVFRLAKRMYRKEID